MDIILKDRVYAWVVVASSSLMMFVGPPTYLSSGLFYSNVDMSDAEKVWICNFLYAIWFIVGILAGPLATRFTHRRVIMIGCFISACGFAITAGSLANPRLSFITYSTLVGIGLGIASHVTFLLVSSHFRVRRGIAIGIGVFSMGIGQALVPLINRTITDAKNIFYIRALMTAVAFMSATLYISPISNVINPFTIQKSLSESDALGFDTRTSNTIKIVDEVNVIGQGQHTSTSNNTPNAVKPSNPILKSKKPQSQFFAGVSANLLPNISEESEIQNPLPPRKNIKYATNSCSSHPLNGRKEVNLALAKKFSISPIDQELEMRITKTIARQTRKNKEAFHFRSISPLSPDLLENKISDAHRTFSTPEFQSYKNSSQHLSPLSPNVISRVSNGQGQNPSTLGTSLPPLQTKEENSVETSRGNTPLWRELFDRIEFDFLRDVRFLNLCIPSVLCILFTQNFPIIFSSYFTSVQAKAAYSCENKSLGWIPSESEFTGSTRLSLSIIFGLDMGTRLGMSYLSDLNFFSRRLAFLIGSFGTTVVCLVIRETEDIVTMNFFCAGFGICFGTMMVTEYLMLVESFGIKKLPSTYGIMNCMKVFFVFILYPIQSPISIMSYNFHPFKSIQSINGSAEVNDFDPLGIFLRLDDPEITLKSSRFWLLILSLPGFLLVILWTLELAWDRRKRGSCHFLSYANSRRDKCYQPVRLNPQNRCNSNPLL